MSGRTAAEETSHEANREGFWQQAHGLESPHRSWGCEKGGKSEEAKSISTLQDIISSQIKSYLIRNSSFQEA